jgi:FMN-dependent NADH-azoreductase
MNVLALNSSPRGSGESKTELMLNSLVMGMQDAGALVEVVSLRKKTIKNCLGCFTCWTKTPGKCILKDDMTDELLPKWQAADLVVYGTPLYHYGMTASMKAFLERTIPSSQPFFTIEEGRMHHLLRYEKVPAVVVLSVCGMPDRSHFNALSAQMRYFLDAPGYRLAAEIYRPAAEMMTQPFLKEKVDDILDATAQAGRELVGSLAVSPGTMARITRPLVDSLFFEKLCNVMWKTCISEGVTPKQFAAKKIVPRPDSLEDFLLLFPLGLDAEAVGERKVTLQFTFSGEVRGACYFVIEKGTVSACSGTPDISDLTIETPFELWMDIMTGKADNRQMLLEQKYRMSGDLSLAAQLFQKA